MAVTLTRDMVNGAILAQAKYGVPASVTLGQIMLESGGNNPGGLSWLAYKDNNLFGIKAGTSWTGKTATYNTQEWDGNKYVTVKAPFRKYDTVAESIDDHGKLLTSSIYTNKTNTATNLNDYVQAMGSVYATDPNYSTKLLNVISSNNLTQYDTGVLPNTVTLNNTTDAPDLDAGVAIGGGNWLDGILGGIIPGAGNFGVGEKITDSIGEFLSDIFSSIVRIIVIIGIIILAFLCFIKAFDINPIQSIKNKMVNTVA